MKLFLDTADIEEIRTVHSWGVLDGVTTNGRLVEIVELRDHPWFVASQFHPEFKSRPERPHPLFDGFIGASLAGLAGAADRQAAAGAQRLAGAVAPVS